MATTVTWLNLHRWFYKDLRKLIYAKLTPHEFYVVRHAHNSKYEHRNYVIDEYAALNGYLELLKWSISIGNYPDSDTSEQAARGGHIHVLQWMLDNADTLYQCMIRSLTVIPLSVGIFAARGGHLKTLEWLQDNNLFCQEHLCTAAAQYGHLELLKWLRLHECPWDGGTCARAAAGGYIHILEWLRLNECPWDVRTCEAASRFRKYDVLKWVRNREIHGSDVCPLSEFVNLALISHGNLEMLKWTFAEGFPLSYKLCAHAASLPDIRIMQWLRSEGGQWSPDVCNNASINGRLENLQWAIANGCPFDRETCLLYAKKYCRRDVVQWLNSL